MICLCAVQSVVRGTVFLQQKPKPAEQRCLPCMAKYYQQKKIVCQFTNYVDFADFIPHIFHGFHT